MKRARAIIMIRRQFLSLALYGTGFLTTLSVLFALPVTEANALQLLAPYPSYDSVIIHPYDRADASGRLLALMQPVYHRLSGRNFTIQEKPGRGGASAWNYIGALEDDSYSLTLTDLPNMAQLSLREFTAFDINELRNICLMGSMPLMLWTARDSKIKNLYDLVAQAQEKPGQIVISGLGSGTVQQLANLRMDRLAGVSTVFLAYSGDHSARQATLSGHTLAFWGHTDPALALSASGVRACRPLAVAAVQRHPLFPEVPTFAELGYDLVETSHFGLAISAKTNAKSRQAVSAVFLNLARDAEFQKQIAQAGFIPAPVGAFELNTYLRSLLDYYTEQKAEYAMP